MSNEFSRTFPPLQAWAHTSRKARDALRRASLDVVHALETRIMREVLGVLPPHGLTADTGAAVEAEPAAGAAAAADGDATAPAPSGDGSASVAPKVGFAAGDAAGDGSGMAGDGSGMAGDGSGMAGDGSGSAGDSVSVGAGAAAAQAAQQRGASQAELQLRLPDGFHRLLVHGIAQFHGLVSFSRDAGAAPQAAASKAAASGDAAVAPTAGEADIKSAESATAATAAQPQGGGGGLPAEAPRDGAASAVGLVRVTMVRRQVGTLRPFARSLHLVGTQTPTLSDGLRARPALFRCHVAPAMQ